MTQTAKPSNNNDAWLRSIFRLAGYGLLISAFLDIANVFIPLGFTDPTWELQTVGELVERVPVPLMGLVLVFYGETNVREKTVLKVLSWATLLAGVLYILLIPLGLNSAKRINESNERQVGAQVSQTIAQLQQRKSQLNRASAQDIDRVFTLLNKQGRLQDSKIKDSQQLKSNLFSELAKAEETVKVQAADAREKLKISLLKRAIKWMLGALVAGVLFILFWNITRKNKKEDKGRRRSRSTAPATPVVEGTPSEEGA
ncbi:HpsJ-like protein, cyanoexosortase A-associated [Anthocerotibacter panamensis]|uniref:HpsJ-like protein, cyanoexosortase A-associated n=1 Tax=Anthocerotibacter panamensis TaxID=2857077 RepID=UPI001C406025|nr:HpsJ family protein [Anthocerotibacter panamensis]